MKKLVVTGTSGFVGKRFVEYNNNKYIIESLSLRDVDLSTLKLKGVDAIIHLAGKAHQMEKIDDRIYFDVNYGLTKSLVDRAIQENVPHFIYISTTKVYGDDINSVLNENSSCIPTDVYGESKLKAELYLSTISSSIKTAVVRPPLVYGPEVKGNLIQLLHLCKKNIPLPFGNTQNARSMVFVDNLIALINTIIEQQATGIYIAGDRDTLSTDKLVSLIRLNLGMKKRLITIPLFLRKIIKVLKPRLFIRLYGSFVVDNTSTNKIINFVPPYTSEYGIEQMVKWFKNS